MTAVVASSAMCPPGEPAPGWVAMEGTTITEVGAGDPPRGAIDLGDAIIAPAFVDLQCNGVADVDLATTDAEGWARASAVLAGHGVGAFLPTFVSAPLDAYDEMLAAAADARSEAGDGHAQIVGVHLEGPFLGGALGAHDPARVVPVDLPWLRHVLTGWPGLVRMVTLAPEADPGLAGMRALSSAGVVVAIGHSTASYDEILDATDAGASVVTHVFNGMAPFHHRAPGLVGAALTEDRLTPTIIADLVHVHAAALRIAIACKPGLAVVSDTVGVVDGLVRRDGAAWLADGRLAGATTLLDAALANVVRAGVPVARAIESVTAAPATIAGLDDRGLLRPGARADVVAIDPRTLDVVATWVGGVAVASV